MSGLTDDLDGARTATTPTRPPRRDRRTVLLLVLALLVLAAVAGAVWALLADPPAWQVTERGVVLTEEAAGAQVGVEMLFVGIGVALCLLWGGVVGWLLGRLGWRRVPLVLVAALAAALLAWRVGLLVGPPDPATVTGYALGDRIPAEVEVDAPASFLVWPLAGLVGLVVVTWLRDRGLRLSEPAEPSPPR